MQLRKALLSTGNAARLQQGWLSDCSHGFDRLFSVCQLLRSKALLLAATSRHAFLHETVHISCQSSPVTPHVDTPYSSFITLLPCCRMSRDQRSKDNWALLYACEVAQRSGSNVVVAFNLVQPSNAVAILCVSCVRSWQQLGLCNGLAALSLSCTIKLSNHVTLHLGRVLCAYLDPHLPCCSHELHVLQAKDSESDSEAESLLSRTSFTLKA